MTAENSFDARADITPAVNHYGQRQRLGLIEESLGLFRAQSNPFLTGTATWNQLT